MGRGAKGNVSKTAAMEDINIKAPLVDAADAGTRFPPRAKMPGHLTPDMGASAYVPSYAERAKKYRQIPKIYAGENELINMKHGGRVTGAAKRGFGRALMKGKK
jgi:hypothetical protein